MGLEILYKHRYAMVSVGLLGIVVAVWLVAACSASPKTTIFNPQDCLDQVPVRVKGLAVLKGTRSKQSLIRDMVPVNCYTQVLFRQMRHQGEAISGGKVVYRITVEYTGEVHSVEVAETTIKTEPFLRRVADLIKNNDFVGQALNDPDSEFLYPLVFKE